MAPAIIGIAKALLPIIPTAAGWLGGDSAEEAASELVGIAKAVTGTGGDQDSVNKIIADPNLQLQFMLEVEKNRTRMDEIYLADRQDARKSHKHSQWPAILSIMLTVIVAVMTWALFSVEIPEPNRDVAYMLFGQVVTAWVSAMAYWFGTSRSSAEKTKLLKS